MKVHVQVSMCSGFKLAQEQAAEAAQIAAERKRMHQEQEAATMRMQAETKRRMREDVLRTKRMQQVELEFLYLLVMG